MCCSPENALLKFECFSLMLLICLLKLTDDNSKVKLTNLRPFVTLCGCTSKTNNDQTIKL
jgi:hypothetical protein